MASSEDAPDGLELRQEDRRCRSRHGVELLKFNAGALDFVSSDPNFSISLHACTLCSPLAGTQTPHRCAEASAIVAGPRRARRIYSLAGKLPQQNFLVVESQPSAIVASALAHDDG